jgi:hypothetical protein
VNNREVKRLNQKDAILSGGTSADVGGSRLFYHVEPRRDLLRDHVRGFAMVKAAPLRALGSIAVFPTHTRMSRQPQAVNR